MSQPEPAPSTVSTASESTSNRIDRLFDRKRAEGKAALIFFLTAGHPDSATTLAAVEALEAGGADLIELGIPFSDPIADGPAIQKSSQIALEGGMSVQGALDLLANIRERSEIPVVFFSGYNPIFRYGDVRFVEAAARAGADGMIIPDLPPEEGGELEQACHRENLKNIFLAAPTTTAERLKLISSHTSGFLYYISLRGVTGARGALLQDIRQNVERIRQTVTLPVAVGFGISEPEQAREIAQVAEGVVVGTALVQRIGESAGKPDFRQRIEAYARSLADALASGR